MTIETNLSVAKYDGNGIAVDFAFFFVVYEVSQIRVVIDDGSYQLIYPTDAVITLTSDGGNVNYVLDRGLVTERPIPTGWKIAILREMPFTQLDSFTNGQKFDPKVIEEALDIACIERQQLLEFSKRAIATPPTSDITVEDLLNDVFEAKDDAEQAATDSANSATDSANSATDAANSAIDSTNSATDALDSSNLAQKWAANPEDVIVEGDLYSSFHYSRKAYEYMLTMEGAFRLKGRVDTEDLLPPIATADSGDIWYVGLLNSESYEEWLAFKPITVPPTTPQWLKIGNTSLSQGIMMLVFTATSTNDYTVTVVSGITTVEFLTSTVPICLISPSGKTLEIEDGTWAFNVSTNKFTITMTNYLFKEGNTAIVGGWRVFFANSRDAVIDTVLDVNSQNAIANAAVAQLILSSIPLGKMEMMPFRVDELPFGWFACLGQSVELTSQPGMKLNSLSANYKADWNIIVTGNNISFPNAIRTNPNVVGETALQGAFMRACTGTGTDQPGVLQGDAIRNITGTFWGFDGEPFEGATGAIGQSVSGSLYMPGTGTYLARFEHNYLNASLVVPTAPNNRPLNLSMLWCIYLGVANV